MAEIGLLKNKLDRKPGNFEPKESFDIDREVSLEDNQPVNTKKNEKSKKVNYKNQKVSIKISKSIKSDLDAIKFTKKLKYDYEVIEVLVEYYKNNMASQDYKKFKNTLEILND